MFIARSVAPIALAVLVAALPGSSVWAQDANVGDNAARASISVETRSIETYPFSDPNPVPILASDTRLYPYHRFEGYAHTSEARDWTVVHLENEWIEVWVLPEIGGKVWGARVKETGHEFIYRNEVLKFRNIALRGPWTSGGIEFNFGVIGHTPSTASPVDWVTEEHDDGSVAVTVGAMDLPSRTNWRVEVRLPADRAYFETNVLWQNPTTLEQPYYNWMTGAAFAQDDLVMAIPGNAFLEHPGARREWPIDPDGRELPVYDQNRFGGNKSYHVVGELNDYFGGYYHAGRLWFRALGTVRRDAGPEALAVGAVEAGRDLGGPAHRHGWAVRGVPSWSATCSVFAERRCESDFAGRLRTGCDGPLE